MIESEKIDELIMKMQDQEDSEAFKYSDRLAKIGGEEVIHKLIPLLRHENQDVKYLAARTLGKMEDNSAALEPLFEAINDKSNPDPNGGLTEVLTEFDCSEKFLDVFKLYLFGNFKTSAMAKLVLDYEEFDITPRTIRKAEKHWNHFIHNVKHDENFELKKEEVETILNDLKGLFEG